MTPATSTPAVGCAQNRSFPRALERRPGNLRRSDSLDVVGTSVRPYQKASLVAVKGWGGGMVFSCASSERPTHGDQGDQSQWFVDQ